MNIGIIAEDQSDVAVMKELTWKMLQTRSVGFKCRVGDGCGKVRRKCGRWADNLVRSGCSWIVVVHDLDRRDERSLRAKLEQAIDGTGARATVVLIPVKEIESWLMYDPLALRTAFKGHTTPRLPPNPESLDDPKSALEKLIRLAFGKIYVNTIYNERIARHVSLNCLDRSRSFAPYVPFVKEIRLRTQRN
jgi:hypothetical protein